jgi:hypothetical protein
METHHIYARRLEAVNSERKTGSNARKALTSPLANIGYRKISRNVKIAMLDGRLFYPVAAAAMTRGVLTA